MAQNQKDIRYCAFLRGVNIRGSVMKMAEVCKVFEKEGMKNVCSVLATGNIIFTSDKNAAELKPQLEKTLSKHFSYDAFLFVKTDSEVRRMMEYCPFEKQENFHIYVFIAAEGTENILMQEFENSGTSEKEYAVISDDTFYWQVPKGNTLESKFGKILGKKNLKDQFTSRNINTFEKIIRKL